MVKKLIYLILLMCVVSCSQQLWPHHWNKCEQMCEKNEGIEYISVSLFRFDCRCVNGARFYHIEKKDQL